MSYLGEMLSKTYLLKVNDVRVLALLKEMRERGQIEIKERCSEITEEYTADAYQTLCSRERRAGSLCLIRVCCGWEAQGVSLSLSSPPMPNALTTGKMPLCRLMLVSANLVCSWRRARNMRKSALDLWSPKCAYTL